MATAQDFFTLEAIASTSGAIAAVTAVSVTIRQIAGWASPKVPFIVSLLVVYAVAGNADALAFVPFREFPAALFWHPLVLLPVLNACLLFTAVLGATGAAHAVERGRRPGTPNRTQRQRLKDRLKDHLTTDRHLGPHEWGSRITGPALPWFSPQSGHGMPPEAPRSEKGDLFRSWL